MVAERRCGVRMKHAFRSEQGCDDSYDCKETRRSDECAEVSGGHLMEECSQRGANAHGA